MNNTAITSILDYCLYKKHPLTNCGIKFFIYLHMGAAKFRVAYQL